jgi:hypothetical protein
MPSQSYYLRQAEVCRSLAKASEDATLRERYERLALDYLERAKEFAASGEQDFLQFLTSPGLAPGDTPPKD